MVARSIFSHRKKIAFLCDIILLIIHIITERGHCYNNKCFFYNVNFIFFLVYKPQKPYNIYLGATEAKILQLWSEYHLIQFLNVFFLGDGWPETGKEGRANLVVMGSASRGGAMEKGTRHGALQERPVHSECCPPIGASWAVLHPHWSHVLPNRRKRALQVLHSLQ